MLKSTRRSLAPRTLVTLGRAQVNASDLKGLRYAWRHRELVLFLGAGVSVPYGLPAWQNLVLELLFEQTKNTRRLGKLWPHYRRAVASWMTDYFGYDPLVLARVVEHYLQGAGAKRSMRSRAAPEAFLNGLRKYLYANLRTPPPKDTLLQSIADLAKRSSATSGIHAIVSFNFDDLLEQALTQRRVKHSVVSGRDRPRGSGLRVVHAHGYVPRSGPLSRQDIVFTEPDYHRLTEAVFHWGLSEIVEHLRKRTVLFIGLSMSDPSLRRLLDASRNADIPPHYQIQKRHEIRDHEVLEVMTEVERRARNYSADMGKSFDETKKPTQLEEAVRAALRQADTYDREVFETMGVKTIWVDDFDQITDVVNGIQPH